MFRETRRRRYLDAVDCFSPEQVKRLKAGLTELMDPEHPRKELWHEYHSNEAPAESGTVLMHALGAWRIHQDYHDLLFHPGLVVPAMQLMGPGPGGVRLLHDQLFCKPPREGAVVAWHQDLSYWTRWTPGAFLTLHIAMDDQAVENGALHYVPGSHRWDVLPVTSQHFGDMDSILGVLDDGQKAAFAERRCVSLTAGQVSFHHPNTVHGSYGNGSDAPRRATVVNMARDGVRVNTDKGPTMQGAPVEPFGAPIGGPLHPVLGVVPDGVDAGGPPPCSEPVECVATGPWALDAEA